MRVLIVDDDAEIRLSLRWWLEDLGYVVDEAGDGEAALAAMRASDAPSVVLLDFMMPRLDGAGVLRQAHTDVRIWNHNHFIGMTAHHGDVSDARKLFKRLNVPVVQKPFDLTNVQQVIEAHASQFAFPEADFPLDQDDAEPGSAFS